MSSAQTTDKVATRSLVEFKSTEGQKQEGPSRYSAEHTPLRALPTLWDAVHPRLVSLAQHFLVYDGLDVYFQHLSSQAAAMVTIRIRTWSTPDSHREGRLKNSHGTARWRSTSFITRLLLPAPQNHSELLHYEISLPLIPFTRILLTASEATSYSTDAWGLLNFTN
jgi:hypothetical protein